MDAPKYDPDDAEDFLAKVDAVERMIRDLKDDKIRAEDVPTDLDEIVDGIREVSTNRPQANPRSPRGPSGNKKEKEKEKEKEKGAALGGSSVPAAGGQENYAPAPPVQPKVAKVPDRRGGTSAKAPERVGSATDYQAWEAWGQDSDEDESEDEAEEEAARHLVAGECNLPVGGEASAFMASVEKDAKQRTERRKKQEVKSNRVKEEGNRLFASGNFDEAAEKYSEAIKLTSDRPHLYVNRAQALIRLNRHKEAVESCDKALSLEARQEKALYHRARARRELKQYSEAIADVSQLLKINPGNQEADKLKAKLVKEKREKEEEDEAKQALERDQKAMETGGAMTPLTSMAALSRKLCGSKDESVIEKVATLIRTILIENVESQAAVILRTSGGLDKLIDHLSLAPGAVLGALAHACFNERNAEIAISRKMVDMAVAIIQLLSEDNDKHPSTGPAMEFLDLICIHDIGILALANMPTSPSNLLRCLRHPDRTIQVRALGCIRTVSKEAAFRKRMRNDYGAVEAITTFVVKEPGFEMQERAAAALSHLCLDEELYKRMLESAEVLPSISKALATRLFGIRATADWVRRHSGETEGENNGGNDPAQFVAPAAQASQLLDSILGFLANLAARGPIGEYLKQVNALPPLFDILEGQQDLGTATIARALLIVSRCVSHVSILQRLTEPVWVKRLVGFLGIADAPLVEISTRILAHFTKINSTSMLIEGGILPALPRLLTFPVPAVIGNAALLISECAAGDDELPQLKELRVVKPLVAVMKAGNVSSSKNAAIALARLSRDREMLQEIRDLQGIEVMHSILAKR